MISLQTNTQPAAFQAFSSSVATALGIIRPSLSVAIIIGAESWVPEMWDTDVMVHEASPAHSHCPYATIAVPARKRGRSSTIARSRKKRRLNISTDPAIAVVKEKMC